MDLYTVFARGGADLLEFVSLFAVDLGSFLALLRKQRAIATGVDIVAFVAGAWRKRRELRPGGVEMDVLCCGSSEAGAIRRFLEAAGYREERRMCRHHLGEWAGLPPSKVACMVRGKLGQRVMHVIELPRSPVQTVLSRSYGSMVGTYLTGGGSAVCLFPALTLVQGCCWVPERMSRSVEGRLMAKYPGWRVVRSGQEYLREVDSLTRTLDDRMVFRLEFDEMGALRPRSRAKRLYVCLWLVVGMQLTFR